ncbi:MAG: hypothetical protein ACYDHY_07890, partial [Acidiferrobacterales bacterium]
VELPEMANVISAEKLAALYGARQQVKLQRANLNTLEKGLEKLEEEVMGKLEAGEEPAQGWTATIVNKPGRCCPAWKEISLEHMLLEHGQAKDVTEYEARKATKVGTTKSLEIIPPIAIFTVAK